MTLASSASPPVRGHKLRLISASEQAPPPIRLLYPPLVFVVKRRRRAATRRLLSSTRSPRPARLLSSSRWGAPPRPPPAPVGVRRHELCPPMGLHRHDLRPRPRGGTGAAVSLPTSCSPCLHVVDLRRGGTCRPWVRARHGGTLCSQDGPAAHGLCLGPIVRHDVVPGRHGPMATKEPKAKEWENRANEWARRKSPRQRKRPNLALYYYIILFGIKTSDVTQIKN